MEDEEAAAEEAGSGRKHRRRGVPMITSEAFENLSPEWAVLHRAIPGAPASTHPDAFVGLESKPPPGVDTVWLSVRVEEALVGVVVLEVGPRGAKVSGTPETFGLVCKPGAETALAEGLLEWLWEDLTEALEVDRSQLYPEMREAFRAAAGRLGWGSEEAEASTVRFVQRR